MLCRRQALLLQRACLINKQQCRLSPVSNALDCHTCTRIIPLNGRQPLHLLLLGRLLLLLGLLRLQCLLLLLLLPT